MATDASATGTERPGDVPWVVPVAVALPLIGLAMLIFRPELDLEWEHHPAHFWIVLLTAAVSVALAYVTNVAAGRYRDARLVLISFAFLSAAGFLGLHALATPGVLVEKPNAGSRSRRRSGWASRRSSRPPRRA